MRLGHQNSFSVLFAVLDWGLGHATRSHRIIQQLVEQGVGVHLAGNGKSLLFLRRSFPDLPYLDLPGYNVEYGRGKNQVITLLSQFDRVRRVIKEEHRITKAYLESRHIHATIADHRFGVWQPDKPSVMIAHQLSLRMPRG